MAIISFFIYRVSSSLINRLIVCRNVFCFIFFFFSMQVNRPLSMKKEGIQTRKRKPKNNSGISGNLAGPSGMHKTEIKSDLLGEFSVSNLSFSFFSFAFASSLPPHIISIVLLFLIDRSQVYLRVKRIIISRVLCILYLCPLFFFCSIKKYVYFFLFRFARSSRKLSKTR